MPLVGFPNARFIGLIKGVLMKLMLSVNGGPRIKERAS